MLYYFRSIVGYILIAWVVSLAGSPLMWLFEHKIHIKGWRMKASTSAAVTLLLFLVLALLTIGLFVPMIVGQVNNLATMDYQAVVKSLDQPIEDINDELNKLGAEPISRLELEAQLRVAFNDWFGLNSISTVLSNFISAIGNVFVTIFSVVFIAFFLLKERELFTQAMAAIAPQPFEKRVKNMIDNISQLLIRYFAGIVLQVTIITLFVSISLWLLGVKYALLIGFFAALVNVIPYVGPIIGGAFGVFITISSHLEVNFYTELLPLLGKVVVVFALVQMLDNFVLQPYIFSNSVLAHPLEIFIVVLMGAQVGGVGGMVLAIPTYTILRVFARAFLSEFKIVKQLTESIASLDEVEKNFKG
ncbi:MAG: AI-2E family transporter [Saprospiraceae bacterium]|nr:AI-2E family transporter [Saprospiraceae bacterium]